MFKWLIEKISTAQDAHIKCLEHELDRVHKDNISLRQEMAVKDATIAAINTEFSSMLKRTLKLDVPVQVRQIQPKDNKPTTWSGIQRELEKKHKVPETEARVDYWSKKIEDQETAAGINLDVKELEDASQVG